MEGHISKRRRVYSCEPTKVVQTMFARNYVSHLVPALNKIKSSMTSSGDDDVNVDNCSEKDSDEMEKIVRHEVDMALAMSTPGFAWSHALKIKLLHQQENINVGANFYTNPSVHVPALKLSSNSTSASNQVDVVGSTKGKKNRRSTLQSGTKRKVLKQKDQEEEIGSRLSNLKSLLPGGDQFGASEFFGELTSYITCLELQVKILRCLVDTQ